MKTRAITGFFFVIVMLASVLLGRYVFSGFYLVLSAFCLYEFYGLIKQTGVQPNFRWGIINGAVLFGVIAFGLQMAITTDMGNVVCLRNELLFLPMLIMPVIFFHELYTKAQAPFANIAYTILGIAFAVVPFMFFHALAFIKGTYNFAIPLGFLIMLWANDTGAYLSGRFFGKRKLFERHSPKKTWEGFIGGVLISIGAAVIWQYFHHDLALKLWICMAVIISCFGTLGDLVESMFKRSINVKDSGGILPGHGGLLDRFDGLLMAAPIVYGFLYCLL